MGEKRGKGRKRRISLVCFPFFFFLMYLFGCFHFHNSPTGSGTHFCTQHEVCSSAGCQANHKAPQQSCCLASLLPFAHPKPPYLLSVGCSSLKSAGGCLEDSPHPAAHPPHPYGGLSAVHINRINIRSYTELGCKLRGLSSLVLQGIR